MSPNQQETLRAALDAVLEADEAARKAQMHFNSAELAHKEAQRLKSEAHLRAHQLLGSEPGVVLHHGYAWSPNGIREVTHTPIRQDISTQKPLLPAA